MDGKLHIHGKPDYLPQNAFCRRIPPLSRIVNNFHHYVHMYDSFVPWHACVLSTLLWNLNKLLVLLAVVTARCTIYYSAKRDIEIAVTSVTLVDQDHIS